MLQLGFHMQQGEEPPGLGQRSLLGTLRGSLVVGKQGSSQIGQDLGITESEDWVSQSAAPSNSFAHEVFLFPDLRPSSATRTHPCEAVALGQMTITLSSSLLFSSCWWTCRFRLATPAIDCGNSGVQARDKGIRRLDKENIPFHGTVPSKLAWKHLLSVMF
jgi:hypothetical protein